jgi:hypothetical protein
MTLIDLLRPAHERLTRLMGAMGLILSAGPNVDPVYSRVGSISNNNGTGMNQPITAAANDTTGVSANNSLVFTADATNGSFIERLRFKAGGSNVASVARIYINNGSANTTATNNVFYGEVSLPLTTATIVAATVDIDYMMNLAIDPAFRIYVGLGTGVSAGWIVTAVAGRY